MSLMVGDLRQKTPKLCPYPSYKAAGDQVDDAALAAINMGNAGHLRFQQKVVVLQVASDDDDLLRIQCLRNRRNEVDSTLKVDVRQAARFHPHGIARSD